APRRVYVDAGERVVLDGLRQGGAAGDVDAVVFVAGGGCVAEPDVVSLDREGRSGRAPVAQDTLKYGGVRRAVGHHAGGGVPKHVVVDVDRGRHRAAH